MFRALESANPYCGKIGELHVEKETRIETILPTYRKAEVIKALLTAHPYEEPAFDLYPLQNSWQQAGAGVIGELETPETELEFLKRIKKTFEVGCLKTQQAHRAGDTDRCLVWRCRSFSHAACHTQPCGRFHHG